jgi:hypothetical protein
MSLFVTCLDLVDSLIKMIIVGIVPKLQKSVWGSPNWGPIPGPYAY